MSRGIAPETFPRETAPLAAMIEPFEQEFVGFSQFWSKKQRSAVSLCNFTTFA
jgi:hypothetical protein